MSPLALQLGHSRVVSAGRQRGFSAGERGQIVGAGSTHASVRVAAGEAAFGSGAGGSARTQAPQGRVNWAVRVRG